MRISWPKDRRHKNWMILLYALALLMACEEYQEGCMDASATNFKVSNQVPCCCEYPKLIFQTTLTDGDGTLSYSDTFTNQLGQKYLIRDLLFLASKITLTDSLDQVYRPVDTFKNYILPADVIPVDVLDLNNTGANFMKNGQFNTLEFSVEQINELEGREPIDFPAGHPLRDSVFYDFRDESWILAQAVIDVVDGGIISMDLSRSDLNFDVNIQGDWSKVRGSDMTVNFRINIETLFSTMDFTRSQSELTELFKSNFPISLEP